MSTADEQRALATLAWLLPTLVTLGLGLVRLPWPGLSNAELAVWGFARTPWSQAGPLVRYLDVAQVPYDVFMHGWCAIAGTSEFALRLPSVLAITVAAGVVAALGRRMFGARAGILAGLLFAVIPAVSRFGQNAGPQSFVVLAAALATLALVLRFEAASVRNTVMYTGALALLGLASMPGLIVLVVAHAVVVGFMRPSLTLRWLATVVIGAVPVGLVYSTAVTAWSGGGAATSPAITSITSIATLLFGSVLAGGAVIGLGMYGVSLRKPAIIVTATATVPVAALAVWALISPAGLAIGAFVTLGSWAVLAAGMAGRYPVARGLAGVAVVGLLGLSTQLAVRGSDGHDQATRALASVLASHDQPGDAIVYGPDNASAQTARDLVARYVPAGHRPADALATAAPRTGGHPYALETGDTGVAKALDAAARIWVIRADGDTNPLDGMSAGKDGELRVDYHVANAWTFPGLTLTLFVRDTVTASG